MQRATPSQTLLYAHRARKEGACTKSTADFALQTAVFAFDCSSAAYMPQLSTTDFLLQLRPAKFGNHGTAVGAMTSKIDIVERP
jgi:hypothetical protein